MTDYLDKQISIFIENQFSRYIQRDGETLVKFIKYYYEWLEEEGHVTDESRRILSLRDSLITEDYFFKFLRDEFMKNLPQSMIVDERFLIRHILDFYNAKGTEEAYKLLFRILYGEEIEFYYPGDDILRASDGRWIIDKYIDVSLLVPKENLLTVPILQGRQSKCKAKLDHYTEYTDIGGTHSQIALTNIFGDFVQFEQLFDVNSNTNICTVTSNGIITGSGHYEGSKGFLSWDKYLQDNYYYQEYSYVIKSKQPVDRYRKIIDTLVHPAGTKYFGQLSVNSEADLTYLLPNRIILTFGISQAGVSEILFEIIFDGIDPALYDDYHIYLTTSVQPTIDFNIDIFDTLYKTETVSLTGLVKLDPSKIIFSYADEPLTLIGNVPINLIGTRSLLIGTNTHFNTDFVNGDFINIYDTVNNANTSYITSNIFSSKYLMLVPQYQFATLTNSNYSKTSQIIINP